MNSDRYFLALSKSGLSPLVYLSAIINLALLPLTVPSLVDANSSNELIEESSIDAVTNSCPRDNALSSLLAL